MMVVVARGGGKEVRSNCVAGVGFSSGMMKYFGTRQRYKTGNGPNATELFTLKYFLKRSDLGCHIR